MTISHPEAIADLFSLFHDGTLAAGVPAAGGADGDLTLLVEIPYLAARIHPDFRTFHLRLSGVQDLHFSTWPRDLQSPPEKLTEPSIIFAAELEILEGRCQDGRMEVICTQRSPQLPYCGGELRFRCTGAAVSDESGRDYSHEALTTLCQGYWDDWSKKSQP